jgi:hypothetical protein
VLPWAKKKPNGRPYPKNNYSKKGARGLAQLVKGLTSKYKALRSNSSTTKKKKKKKNSGGGRREEKEKKIFLYYYPCYPFHDKSPKVTLGLIPGYIISFTENSESCQLIMGACMKFSHFPKQSVIKKTF